MQPMIFVKSDVSAYKANHFILTNFSNTPTYDNTTFQLLDQAAVIGSGRLGDVKLGKILTIGVGVAAIIQKPASLELFSSARKALLIETIILLTLSEHINFSVCSDIFHEKAMEDFGSGVYGITKAVQHCIKN